MEKRISVGITREYGDYRLIIADEFIPDPDCNPDIPRQVTFSDISAAAFNIKKGISKTPCTVTNFLTYLLERHRREMDHNKS